MNKKSVIEIIVGIGIIGVATIIAHENKKICRILNTLSDDVNIKLYEANLNMDMMRKSLIGIEVNTDGTRISEYDISECDDDISEWDDEITSFDEDDPNFQCYRKV